MIPDCTEVVKGEQMVEQGIRLLLEIEYVTLRAFITGALCALPINLVVMLAWLVLTSLIDRYT
jgi:hypothetical protein